MLDRPGGDYWATFDQFVRQQLLDRGMIDEDDLSLYKLTDRVEDAVGEILQFFRVYHSMRYVRTNLVFRLQHVPTKALLDEINEGFRDILAQGDFTVAGPLPEERDESDLASLPRLVFHFDRRRYGRLRQLIDRINRG